MSQVDSFRKYLRTWTDAACAEWGLAPVDESWVEQAYLRLPKGLREAISAGISAETIICDGYKFRPTGLADTKGPYSWLSRSTKAPAINWEYLVQAAEYVRIRSSLAPRGYQVLFEDDLMDVSVYADNELVLCCEVKEKARQLDPLLAGIRSYAVDVPLTTEDRGNDALRKAKYIVRSRPEYFSLAAIGKRLEFSVDYSDSTKFTLREDIVPLG